MSTLRPVRLSLFHPHPRPRPAAVRSRSVESTRHPVEPVRSRSVALARPDAVEPERPHVKSSRTRRKRPFYPRSAGLSRYWRLVDDGQPRRGVPPPHLFDLWVMILASKTLPYRIAGRGNRLRLYVPALLEKLSRHELAAVAAESCKPASHPEPPARHNAHWVLLLLLGLICWHGVRMHWGLMTTLPGIPELTPEAWVERGAVDVFRVTRLHEWYRCVTALTLHADSQHLFGNVLFGAPFLILLCRRVGLGPGLAMVVLAGTLGNVCNVLYRPAGHVSLGFSTALFGTVGALSGFLALQGWRFRKTDESTVSPVAVGSSCCVADATLPTGPTLPSVPMESTVSTGLTLSDRLSWRRGILLLAAGTGILAMLGTDGPRTDYAAHLFGLLAGFGVGGLASVLCRSVEASRNIETLLGVVALFVLIGAWWLAL